MTTTSHSLLAENATTENATAPQNSTAPQETEASSSNDTSNVVATFKKKSPYSAPPISRKHLITTPVGKRRSSSTGSVPKEHRNATNGGSSGGNTNSIGSNNRTRVTSGSALQPSNSPTMPRSASKKVASRRRVVSASATTRSNRASNSSSFNAVLSQYNSLIHPSPPPGAPPSLQLSNSSDSSNALQSPSNLRRFQPLSTRHSDDDHSPNHNELSWHNAAEQFEAEMRLSDSFLEELSGFEIDVDSSLRQHRTSLIQHDPEHVSPSNRGSNGEYSHQSEPEMMSPRTKQSKVVNALHSIHERVAQHVERELSDIIVDIQKQHEEKHQESLNELKQQIRERNIDLARRTKQAMHNMKRMMENLKKQKDDLIAGFVKQKKEFLDEVKNLEGQLKVEEKRVKQLQFENQKMMRNTSRDAFKRQIDSLQKENQHHMLEVTELKSENHKLEEQKTRLDQDLHFRIQEIERAKQEMKRVELEKERFEDRLKVSDQKLTILQRHNDTLQRQLMGTQETVMKVESEKKKHQSILEQHREEMEQMQNRSVALQSKIHDLLNVEQEYKSTRADVVQYKQELEDQREEIRTLKQQLLEKDDSHKKADEIAREKMRTLWQKCKSLKATRDQHKIQCDKLKHTIESVRHEREKLLQVSKHQEAMLKTERDSTDELLAATKLKLKRTKESLQKSQFELQETRDRLKQTTTSRDSQKVDFERRIEALEQQLQSVQSEYKQKQEEYDTMAAQQRDWLTLQSEVDTKRTENTKLQQQVKSQAEKIYQLQSKEEQAKEFVQNSEMKLRMLQASKDNTDQQLRNAQSQLDATVKEKDIAIELVSSLERKNSQLNETIQKMKQGSGVDMDEFVQLQKDHRDAAKALDDLRQENAKLRKSVTSYRGVIQSLRYQYNTK
uniref:Uncharacterized protein n=1 Tax=Percolomonas cosmopolitus TaxID=63605 RepID=A0A7S1KUB9_9EUKA|mmetsp:Transcript_9908/g.36939  ORF Transcript_9908/g.36939 Transcript_9908/m.36939 type:complete len:898 (+) Transcript_9908:187-2880(+)